MNTMHDRNRPRAPIDAQLAAQNAQPSWRDCEYVGLRHRPGARLHVGDAIYTACLRCPTSIRTVDEAAATVATLRALRAAPVSFTSDVQVAS